MKIYIKLDTQRQSDFAANIIKEEMLKKPNLNICFATGNSPIKTYKKLIEMHQNKEISFKNVTSFNLDEYVGIKFQKTNVHTIILCKRNSLVTLILKKKILIFQTELVT
ncbi:hypothetical protein [Mycoplasmopsis cynos]|uniref:hypothetical protein n=1 Tax=Mycoplasmopsis cynos TaxID=171284 RepID=UPI002204400D|nr:hypothetical protein [Mycoplasmopsis cynos]UWV92953.1 hypothetical protein NWE57_02925 [Mycoplasmopsis cynos]